MTSVRIRWPDGHSETADHWAALEEQVWRGQWQFLPSRDAFRAELAHRSAVWSDTPIETTGSAEAFFRELERAGMLTIITEDHGGPQGVTD